MCVCLCVCVYMCVCMCLVCVWMCVRVQSLYVVLPGLLDCNPFPADNSEPCWKGGKGFPEPVRRVLQVRARTYRSLQQMSTYLSTRTHTHAGAHKKKVYKKTWKTIQHHQAKQNMCLCVYVCVCVCVQVFQISQELLQGYQVHPEIQAQMFAYLFFFSNVSLFNQLMDKGRSWQKTHTHTHTPTHTKTLLLDAILSH